MMRALELTASAHCIAGENAFVANSAKFNHFIRSLQKRMVCRGWSMDCRRQEFLVNSLAAGVSRRLTSSEWL